ncbi:endonuclease III [Candidatus Woesearchaeota archaeon]|nr:endonuclease III [Candidatus Woesearchaeota archaeon]
MKVKTLLREEERKIIAVIKTLSRNSKLSMLAQFSKNTPFYILISTVLSARNRDDQTIKSVKKLFARYKTPKGIAGAPISALEPLLKETGFYHTKARRIKELSQMLLDEYDGKVPEDMDELVKLPGVGRKTAGCVLVYAFEKPAIPVDTHVHRISNRLGWIKTKSPLKTEEALIKIVPRKYWILVNEVLVIHGQTTCKPMTPLCSKCPVNRYCGRVGVKHSR